MTSIAPFDLVEDVADAVMYEGYVLYPYRASAMKNRFRWQFGVVAPRTCGERSGSDPWYAQTECLIEGGRSPHVSVKVRCLHLQRRTVEEPIGGPSAWRACERLVVDGREWLTWDEAVPQAIASSRLALDTLCTREHAMQFDLPAALERETVSGADGHPVARVTRERWHVSAVVRIAAERAGEFIKVRVRVENASAGMDPAPPERDLTLRQSLLGCHTLLHVEDGRFVSAIDPPAHAAQAATSCANEFTWPVLAGVTGARDVMLSAPIILYDYPAVAPESRDSFFDATEIDEMLALRVMTMTEEERREAAATDTRAGAIVERTGGAGDATLHGAIRSFEALASLPESSGDEEWVDVDSVRVSRGSRVRLAPQRRADSMDMFLAGRVATVAAVHRDLEDRTYLAVTIDGDPGADLHEAYGRFFYFSPDEVRPLEMETPAAPTARPPRVLVAGLGNIFLGDDAFGVEVVRRLFEMQVPEDVRVADFGIRSVRLAYELRERAYDTVILIDAISKGGDPGTLSVLEPDTDDPVDTRQPADGHAIHPEDVLALVRQLGGKVHRVLIVGCEPSRMGPDAGLTPPVAAAVDGAVQLVLQLIASAERPGAAMES